MFQDEAFAEPIPTPFIKLGAALGMPSADNWRDYRQHFIEQWGRIPGKERWELRDVNLSAEKQKQVIALLSELGLVDAWKPQQQSYDYGVLPGATLPSMKFRLDWLSQLWRKGVRFDYLIVLTGQRSLTPEIDNFYEVMSSIAPNANIDFNNPAIFPMHETEAARLLLHYYPLPKGMEKVPVVFIDSRRHWRASEWERSHTGDTVKAWLKTHPKPGKTLIVSSQPSAHYQEAVFKQELLPAFEVEISTAPLSKDVPLSIMLDAVSVWIRTTGDKPPAL